MAERADDNLAVAVYWHFDARRQARVPTDSNLNRWPNVRVLAGLWLMYALGADRIWATRKLILA
jgi:hypothetical protein